MLLDLLLIAVNTISENNFTRLMMLHVCHQASQWSSLGGFRLAFDVRSLVE